MSIKKLFKSKKDEFVDNNEDEEAMDFEVCSTPITKYKNRRKLMTQQKLLSQSALENKEIGSARSSFNKGTIKQKLSGSFTKRSSNSSLDTSDNERTESAESAAAHFIDGGFINQLGFSKDEKNLKEQENRIYSAF